MDERVIRFRVGVVVMAAVVIAVILVTLLGAWPNPFRDHYTVFIRFPEAPGVTVDTPVRKSGIQIGRVSKLELRPDSGVVVTLKIDLRYPLRMNEICRIGNGSLVTGDAVLEFVRSAQIDAPTNLITDGEYLTNGQVAADPFQVLINLEGNMTNALNSIELAGNQVSRLAQSVTTLVDDNDDEVQSIIARTDKALESFATAMNSLEQVLGDQDLRDGLKKSFEDLPVLVKDARDTMTAFQTTLQGFDRVSVQAERSLKNVEDLTSPFAERGEELAERFDRATRNVDDLLSQLVEFSTAINSQSGSLGQLVHNPDLYNRLNSAALNIEDASRKLRPILNDVRVFSDKIARDPRQLGVRGALDRRPSGSGSKPIRLQ